MDSVTTRAMNDLTVRVLELANIGDWDGAMDVAEEAVEKAREASNGEYNSLINLARVLEIKADLLRQQGSYEDALAIYEESKEIVEGGSECEEMLARIFASIGVLYDFADNLADAVLNYERAIEIYEGLDLVPQNEVVNICNNLGFLYRGLGNLSKAETFFLKGLEICHDIYGSENHKTATLFNNVGSLYSKSGYDEQARNMHAMALESRRACLGENHPETAQSYANLAITLAQINENKLANNYFLQALSIYEVYIKKRSNEYLAVAENYAEFLLSTGDEKGSSSILEMAQKKLAAV